MLLRSVTIENFRALKYASVSFEPTTLLIGENDCGRSSVLEAIALALGWNAAQGEFLFQPFHICSNVPEHGRTVPIISIALEFSESATGEWDGEGFDVLRGALPDALERDRRFWLKVTHLQGAATD